MPHENPSNDSCDCERDDKNNPFNLHGCSITEKIAKKYFCDRVIVFNSDPINQRGVLEGTVLYQVESNR
jgi:hypothetical protein